MTLYTPRLSTASPPLNYLLVLSSCLSSSLRLLRQLPQAVLSSREAKLSLPLNGTRGESEKESPGRTEKKREGRRGSERKEELGHGGLTYADLANFHGLGIPTGISAGLRMYAVGSFVIPDFLP